MATIPLRTYFQHIDHFIEQKQFDEAIAHCKHILNFHPKSLETYRLMGKALLEKNRYGDAGDIFQRVLSSAPDDFISHVGMAIVREDEGNLEAALWHMERAFESNPANGPAQEELRRLYGRRDGVVPSRAQLTRGALARMYVKGELYPQAELELRAALRDDPERLDLSLLLARVLLETGRRAEAAELAQTLLQKIPYALEALRIVQEILSQQNREDEARFYQQRLAALDPYEAYANGHTAASVGAEAVRVPEMGEAEGQAAALALGNTPDWAASLGEKLETPAESEDTPDWLKTGTGLLTGTAALTGAAALTGTDMPAAGEVPDWLKDVEPAQTEQAAADMPDWMKATTGIATGREGGDSGASLTGWLTTPETPASPFDAPAAAQADMPDWLKDIAPPTAPLGGAPATTEPLPSSLSGAGSGPLPEWLNAPSEAPTPAWMTGKLGESTETGATVPIGDVPDWMKESTGALPAETPDLPAWMATAGLTNPLDSAITPFTGEAAPETMPDWLKTNVEGEDMPEWLKNAASTAPLADAPAEPVAPEALPAWMPGETVRDVPSLDTLPEWMQSAATQVEIPSVAAETPAAAVDDLPEWLKGAAAPPSDTPSAAPAVELPDFLQPASTEAIERANTPVDWEEGETLASVEPVADVPDWIKAMAPDPSAVPAVVESAGDLPPVAADDLPDWLKPAAGVAAAGLAAATLGAASTPESEAPAPAEPDVPDLSSMSADDAMRWLESLAAKQGADAETLITKPEERTDTPPAWVSALGTDVGAGVQSSALPAPVPASPAEEEPAPAAPEVPPWAQNTEPGATDTVATWLEDKDTPDWLREARAQTAIETPVAAEPPPAAEPALPDWLQSAPPAAEADLAAGLAHAQPEATLPDLDSMSPDEALRWLESLAAKQGADAETLITKPEERTDTPPAWVAGLGADVPSEALPAPAQPAATPAEDLPDWLKAVVAQEESSAAPPESVVPATPEVGAGLAPDLSNLSDDEAMRWLESLAAKQGADAETLITQPEERTDTPPAWLSEIGADVGIVPSPSEERSGPIMPPTGVLPDIFGESEVEAEPAATASEPVEIPAASMSDDEATRWLESLAASQGAGGASAEAVVTQPEEEPAPQPVSGPPDWAKMVEEAAPPVEPAAPPASEPAPESPEASREPIRTGDIRLSQLASRLAAGRRAKEDEIAARFERERADREKAQREVMEKMEQRRSRRDEAGTGALKPGTGVLKTSTEVPTVRPVPPTETEVPAVAAPELPVPVAPASAPAEPRPAPKPIAAPPVATTLARSRKRRRADFGAQTPEDVLAASRQQLAEGQIEAASEGLEHLVSGGHHLDTIIAELEAQTAARGKAAPLYRVLGDAYMRTGRLQRALDAYRTALNQL